MEDGSDTWEHIGDVARRILADVGARRSEVLRQRRKELRRQRSRRLAPWTRSTPPRDGAGQREA